MQTSNQLPSETVLADAPTPAVVEARQTLMQMAYLLCVVTLCVVWIMQSSINAYWQQTYHRVSPLVQLEDFALWKAGQQLGQQLKYSAAYSNNLIYPLTVQANQYFNNCCLSDPLATLAPSKIVATAPVSVVDPNIVSLTMGDEVLFGGDSLMQGVAPLVQKKLLADYQINSVNLSKQSTGLSYSSFFDWPKTVEQTLAEHPNIRLVVMFLGPNDPWDVPDPEKKSATYLKFKSPEWEAIYRAKIKRIITAAQQHQAKLIWLGPPNMKKDKLNQQMIYLMAVIESEVRANRAIYVDTREMLGNKDDVYADFVINEAQQKTKVRTGDGIHFSGAGVKILAEQIGEQIVFVPKPAAIPSHASSNVPSGLQKNALSNPSAPAVTAQPTATGTSMAELTSLTATQP